MLGPLGHDIIIHVRGVLPGSQRRSLQDHIEFFDQDDLYMRSQDHLGSCPGIQEGQELLDALYRLCFDQVSPQQPETSQERAQRLYEQARTCFLLLPYATARAEAEGRRPAFFTAAPQARRAEFEAALGRARRDVEKEISESLLESPLEKRFWATWHRLYPESVFTLVAQYPINQYRVDFAEIATKTVVEIDGAEAHSGVEVITRDRQRERAIERLGWYVVRFGGREVYRDPERCVRELAAILEHRQQ
jgi:very-short-patch-repair endonuclease